MTSRIESEPAEQRDDAVPAERDAAVRRCAELEGVEQEAELLLRLVLADAHDLEHALLHVAAVDTDRPAADLVAVADDVVGVGERRAGVGVEGVEELRLRRGEGVVHRRPGAGADRDVTGGDGLRGRLEQRRVDDPEERPGVLVDQVAALADLEAGGAEQRRARPCVAPAAKKTQSPGSAPTCRGQPGPLGLGEVLGDRAAELAVLAARGRRPGPGAALLGPLLPGVELLARLRSRHRA